MRWFLRDASTGSRDFDRKQKDRIDLAKNDASKADDAFVGDGKADFAIDLTGKIQLIEGDFLL